MVTEEEICKVKLGDIITVTPKNAYIRQVCDYLSIKEYTGKVIGIEKDTQYTILHLEHNTNLPLLVVGKNGTFRNIIFDGGVIEGTKFFGVSKDTIISLEIVSGNRCTSSSVNNTNTDQAGFSLL